MDLQQKQEKAREAFSKRNENIFANANINEPLTPSDKLDDIVLNSSENIEEDDGIKGYVLFAIAIVVVFIGTIVFMKFMSIQNTSPTNNVSTIEAKIEQEKNKLLQEKLAWEDKKNKDEAKIIQTLKEANKLKSQPTPVEVKTIEKVKAVKPDVSLEITQYPAVLDNKQTPKQDNAKSDKELKDIFKEINIQPQKTGIIAKTEPTKEPKKQKQKPKTKTKTKKITQKQKPRFYIQIGAFSQTAGKFLIQKIKQQGKYHYFTYSVRVNNIKYTKVLIGPYKSREQTQRMLPQVKKDFAQPKAYILKL